MEENLIEILTALTESAKHLSKMVSNCQLDHAQAVACNHVDSLVETIDEYLQWEKRADVPYVCHVKETMQKIYPETIDYKSMTLIGDDGGFYNFQDLYFHKNPFFKSL